MKNLTGFGLREDEQSHSEHNEDSHSDGTSENDDHIEGQVILLLFWAAISPFLGEVTSSKVASDEQAHGNLDDDKQAPTAAGLEKLLVGVEIDYGALVFLNVHHFAFLTLDIDDLSKALTFAFNTIRVLSFLLDDFWNFHFLNDLL